jgi:hypothetical protein
MIRILGLVLMGEEELLQMIHTTISYLKTECDLKNREIAALRRPTREVGQQ